jgi:hypothetical protein
MLGVSTEIMVTPVRTFVAGVQATQARLEVRLLADFHGVKLAAPGCSDWQTVARSCGS